MHGHLNVKRQKTKARVGRRLSLQQTMYLILRVRRIVSLNAYRVYINVTLSTNNYVNMHLYAILRREQSYSSL